MKKIILHICISLIAFSTPVLLSAQEYLLSEHVEVDSVKPNFGKNLSHYLHTYASFGFHLNEPDGSSDIYQGKSGVYTFGLRYKKRLVNAIHLGTDLAYSLDRYRLNTPNGGIDEYKHTYRNHALKLAPYIRLNAFNRGNTIAWFMDITAFAQYNFKASEVERGELNGDQHKLVLKGTDFTEPLSYGAGLRLGYKNFAFFADYYIEQIKTKKRQNYQLTPLVVGLQVNFY